MKPIYIALVDDQKLFLQSLATLLGTVPGIELVFTAEEGNGCLAQLQAAAVKPDIILMDMEMPGMDGMGLNEAVQKNYPAVKVIVLSTHARERLIAAMIDAGASGYLLKNCDKEELLTAIETVHKSGFYINAGVMKAIQQYSNKKSPSLKNTGNIPIELSARERDVLLLICKEKSSAEIAAELFISARTAEGHRNNLLTKTGCRNTAGLVLFAIRYGILQIDY